MLATALYLGRLGALADESITTPGVLPPNSTPFGKTYAQWSEAWWQWCFSLPVSGHPLFGTADCSAGQSGHVWFLGGTIKIGGNLTRNCTIHTGTALFFPIINSWVDDTDCNGSGQIISDGFTEAYLRDSIKGFLDNAVNLSCTIDGVAVQGLSDSINTPYRVQTPTAGGFSYVVPATDNILNYVGGVCWSNNEGTPITVDAEVYHPVGDGVYIMVAPLSVGHHTIHIYGASDTFVEDITYDITVKK